MRTEDKIRAIMRDFDFVRVREIMVATNWKWTQNGRIAIPTKQEMRSTARKLLADVAKMPDNSCAMTGGFCADRLGDWLQLSFVVTSADAGGQE